MSRTLKQLAAWADDIAATKTLKSPPKLKTKEMNYLANTLAKSVDTFSNILEKEHDFARFSSHELRTQIATVSANMELLELILQDLKPNERRILKRMELAIEDMKYQTESLLWLSKHGNQKTQLEPCSVQEVLEKSILDNQMYLHKDQVTLTNNVTNLSWNTNKTLLQIALNNLVRNALQNTEKGDISFYTKGHSLIIENNNHEPIAQSNNSNGFGIGLTIVSRIFASLNIDYEVKVNEFGRTLKVTLPD